MISRENVSPDGYHLESECVNKALSKKRKKRKKKGVRCMCGVFSGGERCEYGIGESTLSYYVTLAPLALALAGEIM
jgi:hypothetical protein